MMKKKEKQLELFIHKQNTPNLLFYGPYMNGKETLCKSFIHKLYPIVDDFHKYVLWINCLCTTGIQCLKEKIRLFSMQIIKKTPFLLFKTIVLQYAEYLTHDSQYSLRRTIEQYSQNTRFILLCEKKQKLLQPICSRFVHYYVNNQSPFVFKHIDSYPYAKYNKYWKQYEHIIERKKENQLKSLFYLADNMAKDLFIGNEIILKNKSHPRFSYMMVLFDKYSKIFRNETLCIFHILCVLRNKSKLQILDVY